MIRFTKRAAADVSTPAADKVTMFIDDTGAAKLKNESGTVASVGGGIAETVVNAKGDLLVASAADTVTRLAVGTDDQVLTADSGEATGLKWADAPSGTSVVTPDTAPVSPNAADYEFEATSTSLPSGWSWVNQGSSTYNEALGIGAADMAAGASDESRSIVRAIPAAGSFTTIVKMYHLAAGSSVWVGRFVVLRDSATGKEMRFSLATPNDASECVVDYYTNPTTFNARRGAAVNPIGWGPGAGALAYMKVVKNSATSWDWYLSHDGVGWLPIHTGINVSTDLTPDQIGVGVNMRARRTILSVHHFRVT